MIVAKCPACNSNKNKVKYGKFLECLDCGVHFYGVYEEEIEPVVEPVDEGLIVDVPVVVVDEADVVEEEKPVKKQVGKPAVKGKVK